MTFSRILGTGGYLPKRVVTNADLEKSVETSDQWVRERTGIRKRHLVSDGETTSVLAEKASLRAIEMAGIDVKDIDLIVLGTTTPDLVYPATACRLQARLGIKDCPAFDVQAVCTGFIYALGIADQFIRTKSAACALVVGVDASSKILDWSDRSTCVLFGDGGGAVVLAPSEEPGILSTHLHADGRHEQLLYVDGGVFHGYDQPAYVKMQGGEVFKMAVRTLGRLVDETLVANDLKQDDLDWLVPHQANIRIINAIAKRLGLSMEQVIMTVEEHGNTSAASVPLALDVGVRDGRIKRGQIALLEAFGGGFTWGSALIRY
uniref:Beta-ketoacyl-[acyl-carrier-protein] synthase III n=1 Tax=Candidatus Kentrum sp. MB TaxID=2138164 RepID=A0A451BDA8_9GAMM|nr:MAG: 3-oxoacyl-[acyl-carrier-protein] synthase III [Candidatus Kentron sp. MB]VFK33588.1 MAG: 3-oxoacyl-[acyl-carrier-protein] synthase III [Candidatus Kentron sp. MB]VFK76267.1 MAG: 3-oxoacyl-[acyl-carrier-protein] synthase III [Candidatus Kentron sp. MB]